MSSVVLRPFVGGLLGRFGRRLFIVWGLLFFIVAMYMYEWVGGIVVLMVLRIFHGMNWGISTTLMLTAVTDMIPSKRRGEGMGWSGMAMTLAMAVGQMLGIRVSQNQSYQVLFLIAAGLAARILCILHY